MAMREQAERLWSSLLGLGARKLAALAVIGLVVFAAVGFGTYYLSRPAHETLYTGLDPQDVTRVGAALTEAGISFDVNTEGNAVMVRYGQTAKARMLLAEKGLPRSESAGYELFDNMGSLGLTSFMQEVTRVRVLEGEIARTIQSIEGIKAARVHIVMPDVGSFRRAQQPPSASVVIRAESETSLASAQAIRHLVAAAVPGLTVEQVTVLGSDGTLLASGDDAASSAPSKLVGLEKTMSAEVQNNITKTLAPYLGLGNFQVSVATRLNTDRRQINETIFDPESRSERSVRTVKETGTTQNSGSQNAVSVDQNLGEGQTGGGGEQSSQESQRKEETTNYEINSKTIATVSDGYSIETLSIAVVINKDRLAEIVGKDAAPEALAAQTKEIEQLVASAAGLNEGRGDKLKVTAVQFLQNGEALEPVPSLSIVDQLMQQMSAMINAVTILVATMLLIWFGLKPAMRMLMQSSEPAAPSFDGGFLPQPMTASPEEFAAALGGGGPAPNLIEDVTSAINRTPQKRLEQMIEYDDEQAAAILKKWVLQAKHA